MSESEKTHTEKSAEGEAWFAKTFEWTCACPKMDVRVEKGKVECGRCGAPIRPRR